MDRRPRTTVILPNLPEPNASTTELSVLHLTYLKIYAVSMLYQAAEILAVKPIPIFSIVRTTPLFRRNSGVLAIKVNKRIVYVTISSIN